MPNVRSWALENGERATCMRVIVCADPMSVRSPDTDYLREVEAAERAGFTTDLISFEALVHERDAERAVRQVAEGTSDEPALYRGWMLRPEHYAALYDALAGRGVRLINDVQAYRHTHHLPESYAVIREHTPATAWMTAGADVPIEQVMDLLRPFGDGPVIVKDFVKSRKHEWDEACYIPAASDEVAVERVVRRFLALQGEDLNEGLVFREFVSFEPLTVHSRSGMPLTKEFRLFFLDGEPVYWTRYWEEGDYAGEAPPIDRFRDIARMVRSRFFTMDVAKRVDGDWMIVELGDAQVAGLPEHVDRDRFYAAVAGRLGWPRAGRLPGHRSGPFGGSEMAADEKVTVPRVMRPHYEALVQVTDAFCSEHLNDEYAALCRRMAAALCRKRPSPVTRGRLNTWACGIVHAIGSVNFLFDKTQMPYLMASDLCALFGVAASTGGNRASEIRRMFRMSYFDTEWCLPSRIADNPLVWMISVNGYIVDVRSAPPEIQREALRLGLIPFLPEEQG